LILIGETGRLFIDLAPAHSNGGFHPVGDNAFENFHEYCIVRTPEAILYTLDGDTKRGVFKKDIGDVFPYRTAKIVATIWDAGSVSFGSLGRFGLNLMFEQSL
jgi:hypothetical protein